MSEGEDTKQKKDTLKRELRTVQIKDTLKRELRRVAQHVIRLRVRYSESDQMGTFYNSRPLEWFECGRSELLRSIGLAYPTLEARGVFLPLVEAHLEFLGRARYDDLLQVTTVLSFAGRARMRCDASIIHVDGGKPVVKGYTVHALTDPTGKPIRPPAWLLEALDQVARKQMMNE